MNLITQYIEKFFYNYGFFIIGGSIGAIIHRMRVKMSPLRFVKFLVIAVILALSAGIVCRDIFHLPETTIYVICGIFGAFSEEILDEIEKLVKSFSRIAKKKFGVEEEEETKKHNEEPVEGN